MPILTGCPCCGGDGNNCCNGTCTSATVDIIGECCSGGPIRLNADGSNWVIQDGATIECSGVVYNLEGSLDCVDGEFVWTSEISLPEGGICANSSSQLTTIHCPPFSATGTVVTNVAIGCSGICDFDIDLIECCCTGLPDCVVVNLNAGTGCECLNNSYELNQGGNWTYSDTITCSDSNSDDWDLELSLSDCVNGTGNVLFSSTLNISLTPVSGTCSSINEDIILNVYDCHNTMLSGSSHIYSDNGTDVCFDCDIFAIMSTGRCADIGCDGSLPSLLDLTLTSATGSCYDSEGLGGSTCQVDGLHTDGLGLGGSSDCSYPDDPAPSCYWGFKAGGNPASDQLCFDVACWSMLLYVEDNGNFRIRPCDPDCGGPPEIRGIVPLSISPLHINVSYISYDVGCGASNDGTQITIDITE